MKNTMKNFKWILYQSKPGINKLIIYIFIGSIVSALNVYYAIASKYLIDSATSGNLDLVLRWLAIIIGISIFEIISNFYSSILYTYFSSNILNQLQKYFFSHITYGDWEKQSNYHSSGMMTRILSDTSTINDFICNVIPRLITSSVTLAIAFFALLNIQPSLSIFIVIFFPILSIVNKLLGKRLKQFYKDVQDKNIEYTSFIQESFKNITIVKTFCNEKFAISKLSTIQNEKLSILIKQTKLSSFTNVIFSLGATTAYFLFFSWGSFSLASGTITFGTMTAILQLFYNIQDPLLKLIGCYSPIITSLSATERLMSIQEIDLEKFNADFESNNYKNTTIHFNNVSYSYKNNISVLKDVSFVIEPGEIVAIVGGSGQGKTTILRLLLDLIHPTNGNIYMCNNHSKENICSSHRELISYVPQGNTLFSGTIMNNIVFGNDNISFEDVLNSCKLSKSFDFIDNLEDKLETNIGENGLGLSEGQAQRISIARSLVQTKPILILDEATSALDSNTEIEVLRSIKNLDYKPTCIIITHRPGALSICDRVLRLEDGYIIEECLKCI